MKNPKADPAKPAADAGWNPLRRAMEIRSGGTTTVQPDQTPPPEPQTEQHEVNDHAG